MIGTRENNADIPNFDDKEFINDTKLLQYRNNNVKESKQNYEEILIFEDDIKMILIEFLWMTSIYLTRIR